jgi:hypothetical protein
VSFVDGPGNTNTPPPLSVVGPAPAPYRPTSASLVSDKGGYLLLDAASGALVVVGLSNGTAPTTIPFPCNTTSGVGCPLAMAYEPFVFRRV